MKLKEALTQARRALAGDSNDAEHDALLALVEALDEAAVAFPHNSIKITEYPGTQITEYPGGPVRE